MPQPRFGPQRGHAYISWNMDKFQRDTMRLMAAGVVEAGMFVRKTGLMLGNNLTMTTPVKSGRAAAGWLAIFGELGGPEPTIGGDGTGVAEGRAASSATSDLTGQHPFASVTNAVNYILDLELGSSDQAPNGIMRIAMHDIRQMMRRNFDWRAVKQKAGF